MRFFFLAAPLLAACQMISGLDGLHGGGAAGQGGAGGGQGGAGGGGSGGAQGGGGSGGLAASGGGGSGGMPGCGDGSIVPPETCEPGNVGGATCPAGAAGTVTCDAACQLDYSGCELCFEGGDDDGDGLADCLDPDCAAPCTAGTCADPFGPVEKITGFTSTIPQGAGTGSFDSPCSNNFLDHVFEIVPPIDGILVTHAELTMGALVLAIDDACGGAVVPLACADDDDPQNGLAEDAWAVATAGQSLQVIVDEGQSSALSYVLDAEVFPAYDEQEPNGGPGGVPNEYGFPFVGTLDIGDVDAVHWVAPATGSYIVRLLPLGSPQCNGNDTLQVYQSYANGNFSGQIGNGGQYNASNCRKVALNNVTQGEDLYFRIMSGFGPQAHDYGLLVIQTS